MVEFPPRQGQPDVATRRLKLYGKEAMTRLQEARQAKSVWEPEFKEAYFFAAPHRARAMNSEVARGSKPQNEEICDTSFATELAGDFVTMIMNTFMPEAEHWATRRAGWAIPDEAKADIQKQVTDGDKVIFEAINASNFHAECSKGFDPDLAIGVVGMWIEMGQPWEPIKCQAVPLHELEFALGPDGNVDFRAMVRHTRNRAIKSVLRGVPLPKEVNDKIEKQPNHTSIIRRCFWRDWEDDSDVVWHYVCMVNNEPVDYKQFRGWGSCHLIVGRFGPCPEWAPGRGPLLKALPDLRQYEELSRGRTDHSSRTLRPPVTYPDDSFTNVQDGIEDGFAYPIRPGTEGAVKTIYDPPPVNAALYDLQDKETRLKRMFYLDFPEQEGKTPPSASQWLDQVTKALRRIGTPAITFWREFCGEVFLRFAWLCQTAGKIQPVQVDGKAISLMPYNPAARAIEQNEVAAFARFVEIAGQAFPEEFKAYTDGEISIEKLAQKLGADKVWAKRDKEQMQGALGMISQLMGGAVPGAPQVGGAPLPEPGIESAPIENRNYITGRS